MTDIVIEVRGGVVVEIYSKNSNTRAVIIDWDNMETGRTSPMVEEACCLPFDQMCCETKQAILFGDNRVLGYGGALS